MQPPPPAGYEIHFSASKVEKMDGFVDFVFIHFFFFFFF